MSQLTCFFTLLFIQSFQTFNKLFFNSLCCIMKLIGWNLNILHKDVSEVVCFQKHMVKNRYLSLVISNLAEMLKKCLDDVQTDVKVLELGYTLHFIIYFVVEDAGFNHDCVERLEVFEDGLLLSE